MTTAGGVLERMIKPINMGFGTPLGSGKQYTPWIHIDDLCKIYLNAIRDQKMQGAYNAVCPEYLNNEQLTRELAKVLNKKLFLPNVPAFILKLIFGQMSDIILKGSRVAPDRLLKEGFEFDYKEINVALGNLFSN
jgi:uncharacterized protein (TIGR01777 family)